MNEKYMTPIMDKKKIDQLLAFFALNAGVMPDLGLFHGRMGVVLLFSLCARIAQNKHYEEYAGKILEELYEEINWNISADFESGLSGIGWGIEYLIQHGLMNGDTDEILKDLDDRIMERDPMRVCELDFSRGLGGILMYVMARLSASRASDVLPFDVDYLSILRKAALIKKSSENEELRVIASNLIQIIDCKEKVKPCVSDLFGIFSEIRSYVADLLYEGLMFCYSSLDRSNANIDLFVQDKLRLTDRNYFLVNEESSSAYYGIKTYFDQQKNVLKAKGWNVIIVTLRSSKTLTWLIEDDEGVSHLYIGDSLKWEKNLSDKIFYDRYYRGVLLVLHSLVNNVGVPYYHLNNMHMADLALGLKLYYPEARIISTVHYMDWALSFLGNREKLKEVLTNPDQDAGNPVSLTLDENIRFLNNCDDIITVSRHSYDNLVDICGIPQSKISLIPHGIKDELNLYRIEEKNEIRKKYGFNPTEILLICAGRIEPLKGIDLLAEAFKNLVSEYPEIRLIIVGGGPVAPVAPVQEKVIPCCGRVTFTGYLDKKRLYELFFIADIGILPSLYEEFGYVALEMMMMELPLVVGNNSGLEEIVENEQTGLVVPFKQDYERSEENSIVLQYAIDKLLQSPLLQKQMGQKGRKRFLSKYCDVNLLTNL